MPENPNVNVQSPGTSGVMGEVAKQVKWIAVVGAVLYAALSGAKLYKEPPVPGKDTLVAAGVTHEEAQKIAVTAVEEAKKAMPKVPPVDELVAALAPGVKATVAGELAAKMPKLPEEAVRKLEEKVVKSQDEQGKTNRDLVVRLVGDSEKKTETKFKDLEAALEAKRKEEAEAKKDGEAERAKQLTLLQNMAKKQEAALRAMEGKLEASPPTTDKEEDSAEIKLLDKYERREDRREQSSLILYRIARYMEIDRETCSDTEKQNMREGVETDIHNRYIKASSRITRQKTDLARIQMARKSIKELY